MNKAMDTEILNATDRLRKNLGTDKGQQQFRDTAETARKTVLDLQTARLVTPDLLDKPMAR